MKLKACYWIPGLALLAAAPAWANYSWGEMSQFRPGIQLGIVVLVLATEVLVVRLILRMTWIVTAISVVGANALSGLLGLVFATDIFSFTSLSSLLVAAIPSTIIEFVVVSEVAQRQRHREEQVIQLAFLAVLAANVLSALVTFGYVYANYRGYAQPLARVERARMRSAAHYIAAAYGSDHEAGTLDLIPRLLPLTKPPAPIDVAPPWLPWAQMRMASRYESALPKRLDPSGKGRPMVWTGAPYLNGLRGVVFSDGRYELMNEGDFQKLAAVPAPPQIAIPPPEPVR